jgi:hypothetical protein
MRSARPSAKKISNRFDMFSEMVSRIICSLFVVYCTAGGVDGTGVTENHWLVGCIQTKLRKCSPNTVFLHTPAQLLKFCEKLTIKILATAPFFARSFEP